MFNACVKSVACLALLAAFTGCQTPSKDPAGHEAQKHGKPALAQPVPILNTYQGTGDAALARHMLRLITSEEELKAIGSTSLDAAKVEFDLNNAVLVTMGEKPTGGYWILIDAAQLVGDTLYVQGVANAPAKDTIVTEALTYPYCLVVVPKSAHAKHVRSEIKSVKGELMN